MSLSSNVTPRIFVSHSSKDNDFGIKLVQDLRRALGKDDAVWYDVSGGLYGGDPWWSRIVQELTNRDIFIIVLSRSSMDSYWALRELDIALNERKRIIPLLYNKCEVRADLKIIQTISFLSPKKYEDGLEELLSALRKFTPPPAFHSPETPPDTQAPPLSGTSDAKDQGLDEGVVLPIPQPASLIIPARMGSSLQGNLRFLSTKRSCSRTIILASLALFVIVSGSIGIYLQTNSGVATQRDNLTATAGAQATAQATSRIGASLTATAQAIATLDASLMDPYLSHKGTLVVNDSLRNPTEDWTVFAPKPNCQFIGGAYHVKVVQGGSSECKYKKIASFSNFVLQIFMAFVTSDTCGGIIFREQSTFGVGTYYDFLICTDGSYKLIAINSGFSLKPLLADVNLAIHQGVGQSNLIAVVANGSNLDFYVNGQKIDHVSDNTSGSGSIGVDVSNMTNPNGSGEVAFNDAKLWEL